MRKDLKHLVFLTLLSLTVSTGLFAQVADTEASGGSVYSYFGLGIPQDLAPDNFKAQGLTGVSGIGAEVMSLANPAAWSRAVYTEATTGFNLLKYNQETAGNEGANFTLQSGYIHLLLPFSRNKFGFSLGLYPVTRTNFRALDQNSIVVGGDSLSYINDIQTKGGVNKFEAGFGVKLSKNFSFGYAPSIAFVTIENNEDLEFSSLISQQNQRINLTGAAFTHRFGVTGTFQGLFRNGDSFHLGATLNLPYTINAKRKNTTQKVVNGSIQDVDLAGLQNNAEGDVEMPLETGFGLGYAPSPLVNIAAEAQYQKWSEYSTDMGFGDEVDYIDRWTVGFGGQYHPYKTNSDLFFSRFKYSAGLSYDSGHLSLQGNDISTLWLNSGLGILSKTASSVDISFRYGFRGTTDNNLLKERIWALGFSINLNELMFIRRKLR